MTKRRGVLCGRFVAEHQEQTTVEADVTGTVRPQALAWVVAVFGPGFPDLRDDAEEMKPSRRLAADRRRVAGNTVMRR